MSTSSVPPSAEPSSRRGTVGLEPINRQRPLIHDAVRGAMSAYNVVDIAGTLLITDSGRHGPGPVLSASVRTRIRRPAEKLVVLIAGRNAFDAISTFHREAPPIFRMALWSVWVSTARRAAAIVCTSGVLEASSGRTDRSCCRSIVGDVQAQRAFGLGPDPRQARERSPSRLRGAPCAPQKSLERRDSEGLEYRTSRYFSIRMRHVNKL